MSLVLRDLGENRQLFRFLKSTETKRHRAGFRRDDDNGRMRPERRRRRRDEVGDPGAVLGDANAVTARNARVAVGHVSTALLVRNRNESNAGKGKQIERVHVSRAHDAEHILDAVRDERLHERLRRRHLLFAGHREMLGIRHRIHVAPSRCLASPIPGDWFQCLHGHRVIAIMEQTISLSEMPR